MASIAEVAQLIEQVLGPVAEQAAHATGFVRRRSKLTGAKFVQTVVLGWLHLPAATLEQLTQVAAGLDVAISPQGLAQRFTEAAADTLKQVLEAAVQHVVSAEPVALPLLQRFTAVTVQDSSTVVLPAALAGEWAGCGNARGQGDAALKVQVRLDLCRGTLEGPWLAAGRAADHRAAVQTAPLPRGALRLADLGYYDLDVLAGLSQQGVYWLSRLQPQTAVGDATGARLDLVRWLRREARTPRDVPVQLGTRQHLAARLLAVPVPPAVAALRRRRLRAAARRKGRPVSALLLALAGWTLLVTNAPPALLSPAEALVLARVRWQIELLFKLWKQHGALDEWRSAAPWRILCEVYAKLLAVLLQHWSLLLGAWAAPDRSWVKAAQVVRAAAPLFVAAWAGLVPLTGVLAHLQRCLATGGRLNRRRRAPNTYQLLLDPPPLAVRVGVAA